MNTSNETNKKRLNTKWIIASIVVPIVVAVIGYLAATRVNKQTSQNNTGISAGHDIDISTECGDIVTGTKTTIYTGITLEEYEAQIRRDRERIRNELQETIRNEEHEKRQRLEIELKAVGEKLDNLKESYEEEIQRLKNTVTALEKFKGELPDAKIEEAKKRAQCGETEEAEKLFDEIYEEGSGLVALAAYQSGDLAEGRIDYAKAMQKSREAQPWLKKLLELREQEVPDTVELAQIQHDLAL